MEKMKFLLLPLICLIALGVCAQPAKGRKLIGASIGGATYNPGAYDFTSTYGTTTTAIHYKDRTTSISLTPLYGLFVSDRIILGASMTIGYTDRLYEAKEVEPYRNESSTTQISLEPFMRIFFGDRTSGLLPYFHLAAGLDHYPAFISTTTIRNEEPSPANSYTFTSRTKSKNVTGWRAGAGFGMIKMLNKYIGLDVQVNYYHEKRKSKYNTSTARVYDEITPAQYGESSGTTVLKGNPIGLKLGMILFMDKKASKK